MFELIKAEPIGTKPTLAFVDGPGVHELREMERKVYDDALGREIRSARVLAGVTLRQAARASQMSDVEFSQLERGLLRLSSEDEYRQLLKLIHAFKSS
jgi:hypothetical protein